MKLSDAPQLIVAIEVSGALKPYLEKRTMSCPGGESDCDRPDQGGWAVKSQLLKDRVLSLFYAALSLSP